MAKYRGCALKVDSVRLTPGSFAVGVVKDAASNACFRRDRCEGSKKRATARLAVVISSNFSEGVPPRNGANISVAAIGSRVGSSCSRLTMC